MVTIVHHTVCVFSPSCWYSMCFLLTTGWDGQAELIWVTGYILVPYQAGLPICRLCLSWSSVDSQPRFRFNWLSHAWH